MSALCEPFCLFGHLVVGAVCGAALGLEREMRHKPAGLRTNMLIAVGAALFTYCSERFAAQGGDAGRVAAQIVTGVGFIGAGAIMQIRHEMIHGLTTAATVWVVAALGMLAGMGYYGSAVGGTVLALLILEIIGRVELWLLGRYQPYELMLQTEAREGLIAQLRRLVYRPGVDLEQLKWSPGENNQLDIRLAYQSTPARSRELMAQLKQLDGIVNITQRIF